MNKKHSAKRYGKKGQEMLIDFWSILIFAAIIIVFLIFFFLGRPGTSNVLESSYINSDAGFILAAFTESPAVGIDEDRSVSQIIIEDIYYQDSKNTRKLFEDYFSKMQMYDNKQILSVELCTNYENAKESFSLVKKSSQIIKNPKSTSSTYCQESKENYAYSKMFIPHPEKGVIELSLGIEYEVKK